MSADHQVNPNSETQRETGTPLIKELAWRAMLVLAAALLSLIAVLVVTLIYAVEFAFFDIEVYLRVSAAIFISTFLYFMYRFHEGNWGEH